MPFLPPNQQRESTETTPSTRFSKVGPCSIEMLGLGCESYFPFHFLLFGDAFLWSYSKILWELVAPEFVEALFSWTVLNPTLAARYYLFIFQCNDSCRQIMWSLYTVPWLVCCCMIWYSEYGTWVVPTQTGLTAPCCVSGVSYDQ